MSQISRAPLRTTYCVVQIGSRLARFACGMKRNVFASAARDSRGAASGATAASAAVFKKPRRSIPLTMFKPSCLFIGRYACRRPPMRTVPYCGAKRKWSDPRAGGDRGSLQIKRVWPDRKDLSAPESRIATTDTRSWGASPRPQSPPKLASPNLANPDGDHMAYYFD